MLGLENITNITVHPAETVASILHRCERGVVQHQRQAVGGVSRANNKTSSLSSSIKTIRNLLSQYQACFSRSNLPQCVPRVNVFIEFEKDGITSGCW